MKGLIYLARVGVGGYGLGDHGQTWNFSQGEAAPREYPGSSSNIH